MLRKNKRSRSFLVVKEIEEEEMNQKMKQPKKSKDKSLKSEDEDDSFLTDSILNRLESESLNNESLDLFNESNVTETDSIKNIFPSKQSSPIHHKLESLDISKDSIFLDLDLSALEKECEKTNETNETFLSNEKLLSTPENKSSKPNKLSSAFTKRIQSRLIKNAQSNNKPPSEPIIEIEKATIDAATAITQENEKLFYGLPPKVRDLYRNKGIKELYDWQKNCLKLQLLSKSKNLIYSLPTSGGKTLVAEILMLRTILLKKLNVIIILPFVALVQEKIQTLAESALELDFIVEEYAAGKGRFPPCKRRKKNSVYMCTIEKASSLVDALVEAKRLKEVGLVIIDELHMIGDGGRRGSTIETTLAKIMHVDDAVQLVGMSATLSNIDDVACFMDNAEVYIDHFRPVQLDEFIKCRESIYKVDLKKGDENGLLHHRFIHNQVPDQIDVDRLTSLVTEVVPSNSCLMFCPTKKNCENVATMLCSSLPQSLLEHEKKQKILLLRKLRADCGGVMCPTLIKTIPFGIAYHHSGLMSDERVLIEEAYRSGVLCLLTCTSTLAAGVNLPARRVIIRSPRIGNGLLSRAQYRQMIGRAGRAGIDSRGESYLVVPSKQENKDHILQLISGSVESCVSSLMYDGGDGFNSMLLNVIGLKIVTNISQVHQFFSRTFFHHQLINNRQLLQKSSGIDDVFCLQQFALSCLDHLQKLELIKRDDNKDSNIRITNLGIATFKSSIQLETSSKLYTDLRHGLDGLVLTSYLHLLFLVTPYELADQVKPDWLIFMNQFGGLNEAELSVATRVGCPERYVVQRASGRVLRKSKISQTAVNRFYLTLMIYQIFNGSSLWDVASRFDQNRGFLQSLITSTLSFTSRVFYFTQEIEELWPYRALFDNLIRVLQHSSSSELIPLLEIPGVKLGRAKQLYKCGLKTLAMVANGDYIEMSRKIGVLSHKQAKKIITSAKVLLAEKVESLESEVENLKDVKSSAAKSSDQGF